MPTSKPMRYAHSDGQTDLCYDESGKYILTCGSDGDVRIWEGVEDDDAISHRAGDKAFCILCKNGRFITTTESNTVQAHTFPEGASDGILTRFTAPVIDMCMNQSGTVLVAGSSDFTIKVVDVDTCNHKTCRGHEAPVLGVALDPQEEFVASSSCDGTVRIWKTEDKAYTQVKVLKILPQCSDVSLAKGKCRLCWDRRKGEHLYVPLHKEIQIYEKNTWNKVGVFTEKDFDDIFSVLAVSPDNRYLAAGCYNGHILVFDTVTKNCVDRFKHDRGFSIMSLAWNPKKKDELVFCDREGQLGQLEDIQLETVEKVSTGDRAKETLGIFDDEDDGDLIMATNENDAIKEDQDVVNDDAASDINVPLVNDIDTESKKDGSDVDDADDTNSLAEILQVPAPVVREKTTPLQPPFQPGSTPVHLSSRFMIWNSIGIIKQYNTDEENSIDIEFHDTSIHHSMHVTNTPNYIMADMSTDAVILASEIEDDVPSKLMCMHFSSWDTSKEWTVPFPDGEEIKAITIGEDWIAAASDMRNIRIFTIGGIQREVFSIPGPVVCLAAHTNQLLIVYHKGVGVPGDQCLGVHLICIDGITRNILNHEPLPLSVKSTLSWIGFSAEGTPMYMDSRGIVRMCNRKFGPSWIQVADTKSHTKGKSDNYWIVGAFENPQQLRCIPCKGSRYPATLPRPAVAILPYQIPLCEMNTEKSQYEETLSRTHLFSNHFDHWSSVGYEFDPAVKSEIMKPSQEAMMKLFALSTRSDREFRALEVCEMMTEQHTLQLAIKYASRLKHMHLAERISEVAQRKAEEELARQEGLMAQEDEEEDLRTQLVPSHMRNGIKKRKQNGYHEDEEASDEVDETVEEIDVNEEEDQRCSGPLLNVKSSNEKTTSSQPSSKPERFNPFKVLSQEKTSSGSAKGTHVFDNMPKKKQTSPAQSVIRNTKPIKQLTKKGSGQGKLFPVKQKKGSTKHEEVQNGDSNCDRKDSENIVPSQPKGASAFDLWFEENKVDLQEEHPEISEEELTQLGAESFRNLPKEERQEWIKKAKLLKSENSIGTTDNKKRKRDDDNSHDDTTDIKKKKESVLDSKLLSQNTSSKLASFAFQKE